MRGRRAGVIVLAVAALLTPAAGTPDRPDVPAAARVDATPGPAADDPRPTRAERAVERRREEAGRPVLTAGALGTDARPNLLVLMTDDMRADDLRFMPQTRRLLGADAEAGATFVNALAPHPLCCPARASFLNGRYTHNHGVWSHKEPFGFRVLDDAETLPVWLQRAGYATAFTGKYLNGYGSQRLLSGGPSTRYVPPGWTDWRAAVGHRGIDEPWLAGSPYRYFDTTLNVGGVLEPHPGEYQTHLLGGVAREMVREAARSPQPFFAHVSFTAPHTGGPDEPDDPVRVDAAPGMRSRLGTPARPSYVHGRFDAEITGIPGRAREPGIVGKPVFLSGRPPMTQAEVAGLLEVRRQRAEALAVVDEEVGAIMATLAATGQLDDTIVLFTSDNGYFLGEHRMRTGKTLAYDPSLRVPLLVRGPGVAPGVRRDPFLTVDVAPTLLAAAGVRPPEVVDGVSLLGVLRDGDRGWTRPVLTESGPRRLAPLVRRGLLPEGSVLDRPHGPSPLRFSQGVRTERYLYVEHASDERELYDLVRDPGQLDNVVADESRAGVVRRLAAVLDRLRTCSGEGCARPLPPSLRTGRP